MTGELPDEVDVLVAGFGAAGAAAAIAAQDAGARVAIVEKMPAGGGNCPHSGGFLFCVDGPRAIDHLDALCFGKTDRPVLEAYAAGLPEVPAFLRSLGGATAPVNLAAFGGMLPSWPYFPGAGHVSYRQFTSPDGERAGLGLWRLLERAVSERGIPIFYDAPVVDLLCDGGRVVGAIVGSRESAGSREIADSPEIADSREIAGTQEIAVRGGVILASGSFESDPELRDAYLPLPLASVGHPGNTGDTLALTSQAGGALWHMSAFFGWPAFVHPDFPAGFTLDVHAPSFLMLDGDGRRFSDETGWEVHDRLRALTAYHPRRRNRPRMPGWIVFDETARVAGPLHGIVGSPNEYAWSPDNAAEVDKGWIQRGDDAAELAAATGLDAAALAATLDAYAAAAAVGRDEEFGRSPETLVPLGSPLYAIAMTPAVATASGGPRRDACARVLRPGGAPVPGLYAAGGAGSIWGHLTEHGGGLTDAIVFGRIAGSQASGGSGAASAAGAASGSDARMATPRELQEI